MDHSIRLTFTGDFIPNEKTLQLVQENRTHEFAPEVSEIHKQSDFSIVNLETPLTTVQNPIKKLGNNFMAHPDNAKLIKGMGFDAVTLSNNHILDQNELGVFDTINACEKVGLKTVGADKNLSEANKPLILNIKNKKIGIINICEQEFNIATEKTAGANPFTAIDAYYQITELRPKVDHLIVIFHGGLEYHHIPLPGFIKNCKFMVDCGANAVICHHTHYISGYEYYKGKPIFYGLGNFYADSKKNDSKLNKSIMVSLIIHEKHGIKNIIYEIKNNIEQPGIFIMDKYESQVLIDDIKKYNAIISNKNKIKKYWDSEYNKLSQLYVSRLISQTKLSYQFRKRIPLLAKLNNSVKTKYLNLFRCESHREVLQNILKK